MINITRPWWPPTKTAEFIDPFVGTGATWFEALKAGMNGHCVDNEILVEQMVSDNMEFFCITPEELFLLNASVWGAAMMRTTQIEPSSNTKHIGKYVQLFERDDSFWQQVTKDYDAARELFKAVCPDQSKHEANVTPEVLVQLQKTTLTRRVLFYLTLRTHRRRLAAMERETILWTHAYRSEAIQLAEQMEELQELLLRRQNEQIETRNVIDRTGLSQKRKYALFDGKYSLSCSIPMHVFRDAFRNRVVEASIRCADARDCPELPGTKSKFDRKAFNCGDAAMNDFLRRYARQSHDPGGAKTIRAIDNADNKTILVFYSLAPGAIAYAETPETMRRGIAQHDVPGFRLARIATHVRLQGQGLGGQLLAAAARRCLRASVEVGGVVPIIDVKNTRAARWYAGYGAVGLSNKPLTLVMSRATFAAELQAAEQI